MRRPVLSFALLLALAVPSLAQSTSPLPACPTAVLLEYQDASPDGSRIWGYPGTTADAWWIRCTGCVGGGAPAWIEEWATGRCSAGGQTQPTGPTYAPTEPTSPPGPPSTGSGASGYPTCPSGITLEFQRTASEGYTLWGYAGHSEGHWWNRCVGCVGGQDVVWIVMWATGRCPDAPAPGTGSYVPPPSGPYGPTGPTGTDSPPVPSTGPDPSPPPAGPAGPIMSSPAPTFPNDVPTPSDIPAPPIVNGTSPGPGPTSPNATDAATAPTDAPLIPPDVPFPPTGAVSSVAVPLLPTPSAVAVASPPAFVASTSVPPLPATTAAAPIVPVTATGAAVPTLVATAYPLCPADKKLSLVKPLSDGRFVWKPADGTGVECSGCPGEGTQTKWDAVATTCKSV